MAEEKQKKEKQHRGHHASADETLAIRLNSMDLVRACEQTAIVMSICQGRGVRTAKKTKNEAKLQEGEVEKPGGEMKDGDDKGRLKSAFVRNLARDSMLGYLRLAECDGKIVQEHETVPSRVKTLTDWLNQPIGRRSKSTGKEEGWDLDIVLGAVDGVHDLLEGFDDGTVTFIVGGRRDSFNFQWTAGADTPKNRYFMVITGKRLDNARLRTGLCKMESLKFNSVEEDIRSLEADFIDESPKSSMPIPVSGKMKARKPTSICENETALRELAETIWGARCSYSVPDSGNESVENLAPFTVGTMSPAPNTDEKHYTRILRHHLGFYCRTRAFVGGAVAAAVSALGTERRASGVDAFVGIVNQAQATAIAVAAKDTNQAFCAFAVTTEEVGAAVFHEFRQHANLRGVDDFIHATCPFLIVTGITENLIVDGVRYQNNDSVHTQTLLIRAGTRTKRIINNWHDLSAKTIHFFDKLNKKEPINSKTFKDVCEEIGEAFNKGE